MTEADNADLRILAGQTEQRLLLSFFVLYKTCRITATVVSLWTGLLGS